MPSGTASVAICFFWVLLVLVNHANNKLPMRFRVNTHGVSRVQRSVIMFDVHIGMMSMVLSCGVNYLLTQTSIQCLAHDMFAISPQTAAGQGS